MSIFSRLSTHYLKGTKRKIKKQIGDYGTDPYMKYREIDLFREILENVNPEKVLEYGCGLSTLYYPDILSGSARWISVEHNDEWYEQISPKIREEQKKVSLFNVKPDIKKYPHDGYYEHFHSYVDFPESHGPFDLILVDGMAREACIEKSMEMLTPDGLLVVHDCNRRKYHDYIKEYPNWLIMEDFRKTAGGFGFATKSRDITALFRVEHHRELWKTDSLINNFFKFKFLLNKPSKPFRMISSKKELEYV
jgi:predicted O-methyltransferase YrrM